MEDPAPVLTAIANILEDEDEPGKGVEGRIRNARIAIRIHEAIMAVPTDDRMTGLGMESGDYHWIHNPGPTCPRKPCYGQEDGCTNGRHVETWYEVTE